MKRNAFRSVLPAATLVAGIVASVAWPAIPAAAKDLPDLTVTKLTCTPTAVPVGKTVKLRAEIANVGAAPAAKAAVGFYLDGKPVGKQTWVSLDPKQSAEVDTSFEPEKAGSFKVQVRADADRRIAESNEGNNASSVYLKVYSPPSGGIKPGKPKEEVAAGSEASLTGAAGPAPADLSVGRIRYSGVKSPFGRGEEGVSVAIANLGKGAIDRLAFERSRVQVLFDGKPALAITRLDQLLDYEDIRNPGSKTEAWIPWQLQKPVRVQVSVNVNGAIPESNPGNNSASAVVGADPDEGDAGAGARSAREALSLPGLEGKDPGGRDRSLDARAVLAARSTRTAGALASPDIPMLGATAAVPDAPGRDVVPLSVDYGIEMTRPREGDLHHPGGSITIRYRFSREVAPGGDVTFAAIHRGTGAAAATTSVPHAGPSGPDAELREATLVVPAGSPNGEYCISASHPASGASGLSDSFRLESFGEGGGFATGGSALFLVTPRRGDHYPFPYDGINVRWRYRGPLADFPARWTVQVLDADGGSAVTTHSGIVCDRPVDAPPEGMETHPTRTCSYTFIPGDGTPSGNFRMRVSGGDLSAETSGPFHWGLSWAWPFIQLFNPTPTTIGPWLGEPIPVRWSVNPESADLIVRLYNGTESVYAAYIPRSSCGEVTGEVRTCDHLIPTGGHLAPGRFYRVVVHSLQHPEARAERGPFALLENPDRGTVAEAVDISLPGVDALRVTETGRLEARGVVSNWAGGPPLPASYRLAFLVGRGAGAAGGIRFERDVPTPAAWVDLGHIDAFATAEDRRLGAQTVLTVRVNQPPVIDERNYENNIREVYVPIRPIYATVGLSALGGFISGNTLYFEREGRGSDAVYRTELYLSLMNRGYQPVNGTVLVRQRADSAAPGELSTGSYDRINLGTKEIRVDVPESVGEPPVNISIFGSGVSDPVYREGELEIILGGDFLHYGPPGPWTVNFRYRD